MGHGHPCDPSTDGCWPADPIQNSKFKMQHASVRSWRELPESSVWVRVVRCACGICDLGVGMWNRKKKNKTNKQASIINHHHRRERRDTVACSIIGHTQSPKSLSGAQLEFQHMGTLAVQAFVVCRLSVVLLPIPYSLLLLAIGREDC